jgi:hypothetical protein
MVHVHAHVHACMHVVHITIAQYVTIIVMKDVVPDQSVSFGVLNDPRSWRMTSDIEDTDRRTAFLRCVFSGGSLGFQV